MKLCLLSLDMQQKTKALQMGQEKWGIITEAHLRLTAQMSASKVDCSGWYRNQIQYASYPVWATGYLNLENYPVKKTKKKQKKHLHITGSGKEK